MNIVVEGIFRNNRVVDDEGASVVVDSSADTIIRDSINRISGNRTIRDCQGIGACHAVALVGVIDSATSCSRVTGNDAVRDTAHIVSLTVNPAPLCRRVSSNDRTRYGNTVIAVNPAAVSNSTAGTYRVAGDRAVGDGGNADGINSAARV